MVKSTDYKPHRVSYTFLVVMTACHVATYLLAGIILNQLDHEIPFYTIVLCTYITEVLALLTHWAGHHRWSGIWYEAHIAHHTIDYPPNKFLSDGYKNAKHDNSVAYIGAIVLTPIITCALMRTWTLKMFVVTLLPGLLVLLLADYLHMAFHTNGHWLEKYQVFQHLRALHYYHHKGTFLHNYAIGDFFLD